MSNEKKNATLSMSHGTACGRLRKNILFSLLCKLKENVCFKCGKLIERTEDLSIEHKEPWEGRSAELFWDLDNIAFSHLKCNRPHSFNREDQKKVGPAGTAWCSGHKQFLPIGNFWKQPANWSGVHRQCAECMTKKDVRHNHSRSTIAVQ